MQDFQVPTRLSFIYLVEIGHCALCELTQSSMGRSPRHDIFGLGRRGRLNTADSSRMGPLMLAKAANEYKLFERPSPGHT